MTEIALTGWKYGEYDCGRFAECRAALVARASYDIHQTCRGLKASEVQL